MKVIENTINSRLLVAPKEIRAHMVSKKLALASIKALQESKYALNMTPDNNSNNDESGLTTLSLEEYNDLSKRAHESEEDGSIKVVVVLSKTESFQEMDTKLALNGGRTNDLSLSWRDSM